MNNDIINKYLKNKCSDKEFEEFIAWLENEALDKKSKDQGFAYWQMLQSETKENDGEKYGALLDKIHHKINLSHKHKAEKIIALKKITLWVTRAAAILFLPLLGILFYLLTDNDIESGQYSNLIVDSVEIIAPIGSQAVVQLADGTKVNLNYGSKIKYPRNFVGKTRDIILSGEAYFDVAHNPEKPFIVKTEKLNIKALGTEFNVHAYPDDYTIATTLAKGKVAVEKILPGKNTEQLATMSPGEHVIYCLKSDKITCLKEKNINKYIAWKDGKMVFDNDPITVVAKELSRKFNVDIEIADNIKYLTYTVTFEKDPLFLILDLMTETTPIKYKKLPRTKLPDGTFSKQKIIIEKK